MKLTLKDFGISSEYEPLQYVQLCSHNIALQVNPNGNKKLNIVTLQPNKGSARTQYEVRWQMSGNNEIVVAYMNLEAALEHYNDIDLEKPKSNNLKEDAMKWWGSLCYNDQLWMRMTHDRELLPKKFPLLPENIKEEEIIDIFVSVSSSAWWCKLSEDEIILLNENHNNIDTLTKLDVEKLFLNECYSK